MNAVLHAQLAGALLDPARTVPGVDEALLSIHRNTATWGLLEALRGTYPTTRRLLGNEAFDSAALLHLRTYPPTSPVLLEWGHGFPEHLAGMPGMEAWSWIADVAKLESARRRAYHAEDRARSPMSAEALRETRGARWQLAVHPSTQALGCGSPALDMWLHQNGAGDPPPPHAWRAALLVIWRRDEALLGERLDARQQGLLTAASAGAAVAPLLAERPQLIEPLAEALEAGWLLLAPLSPSRTFS